MPRAEQETYIQRLAKLGYCWQFITLAGLHTTALISDQFAKAYSKQGMRAYGELVQEPEMESKCDVVTHQKWSGANYVDNLLKMVQGGVSSTSAMGKGVSLPSICVKDKSLAVTGCRYFWTFPNAKSPHSICLLLSLI